MPRNRQAVNLSNTYYPLLRFEGTHTGEALFNHTMFLENRNSFNEFLALPF